ncbi:MAG: HAD family hydrolase, partial [Oscillospiraceae bacterium]
GVIAILSNKPNEFVEEINKTVFGGVFDVAVGQRKGNKTKPDKTALCDIMKSFGAKKCQCVFVGDSYVDVLTAKNADILSVAVSYGFGKQEEILKYCPDYVCHSVEELSHLLIELQNK